METKAGETAAVHTGCGDQQQIRNISAQNQYGDVMGGSFWLNRTNFDIIHNLHGSTTQVCYAQGPSLEAPTQVPSSEYERKTTDNPSIDLEGVAEGVAGARRSPL